MCFYGVPIVGKGLFIFNLYLALLGSHKHFGKKLIEYKAWNHLLDTIIEILLKIYYIYPIIVNYKLNYYKDITWFLVKKKNISNS